MIVIKYNGPLCNPVEMDKMITAMTERAKEVKEAGEILVVGQFWDVYIDKEEEDEKDG